MNKKLVHALRNGAILVVTFVVVYRALQHWDAFKAWIVRLFH
jgi:hypothetical protein